MLVHRWNDPVGQERSAVLGHRDPITVALIGSRGQRIAEPRRKRGVQRQINEDCPSRQLRRQRPLRRQHVQVHVVAPDLRRCVHHQHAALRHHTQEPVRRGLLHRPAHRGQRRVEQLDEPGNGYELTGGKRTLARIGDQAVLGLRPSTLRHRSPVDRPAYPHSSQRRALTPPFPRSSFGQVTVAVVACRTARRERTRSG